MHSKQLPWLVLMPLVIALLLLGSCLQQDKPSEPATQQEAEPKAEAPQKKKVILFFGNSITAGYGLELTQAFPALIGKRLDSLEMNYTVVNAGLSGETTSGGLERVEWVLQQPVDVFVLELGANDGLRGINTNETEKNLQAIIDKVREKDPAIKILLTGMMVPPNMGPEFAEAFQQVFTTLAERNDLPLVPFILDGVAGDPELNLSDGIHPTPEGHHIVANNVWEQLEPLLN